MAIQTKPILIISLLLLALDSLSAQAVKSYPLDDRSVYHLKVATDKVTTVVFPDSITALEGSGIATDPKQPARMLLSYSPGEKFFSIRAETNPAIASLNVVSNDKVYILELATDPEPFQSVRFYSKDQPIAWTPTQLGLPGQAARQPTRLLALLDQAKAFPLLREQYPEMASQIDHAEPCTRTSYSGFDVILTQVFRFDQEDALIFAIQFNNHTLSPIRYVPQSLGVRVGPSVYWGALSQGSGLIPSGFKLSGSSKEIVPGHSTAYFVICGNSDGGRNQLAVTNSFNILVFRQEQKL